MYLYRRIKSSQYCSSLSIKESINLDFCAIYTRTYYQALLSQGCRSQTPREISMRHKNFSSVHDHSRLGNLNIIYFKLSTFPCYLHTLLSPHIRKKTPLHLLRYTTDNIIEASDVGLRNTCFKEMQQLLFN